MEILWLCYIIFIIFLIWIFFSIITDPDIIQSERAQLVNYRHLIQDQHQRGQITDDEFYEKYYDYKDKMKDWEIKSGYATWRERTHPYWKGYYRRYKERKNKK